ncbi:replicative DNA helicase [Acetobacter cerevisiae]|uniref:replicative DNA helicase n=1 Tax=Acetobacter cerevisiae TaxID=178900 RepID=UPI00209C7C67|nr:DnaB-like helicase C-terminal domain-containing protein [Acetobacter cerevisiae]MCP1270547.1 AAA family ATPase [Acetobacter cerevisiae]MCP1278500.1 AAA family ATPase [Acetobacter cerevisiae]
MSGLFDAAAVQAEMPRNLAAEQSVLGAILTNNRAYEAVCDFLEPRHFYSPVNGWLFEQIQGLIQTGGVANPVTLKPLIDGADRLADVGGFKALVPILMNSFIGMPTVKGDATAIRQAWVQRELLQLSADMRDMIVTPDGNSPDEVVDYVENGLLTLAHGRQDVRQSSLSDAIQRVLQASEDASKRDGIVGVSSGYEGLDNIVGGFEPGTLTIIAGRPAMGKTAAGVGIAVRSAKRTGKRVLYWSGEVSAEAISQRIIASKTKIPVICIRSGKNRGRQLEDGKFSASTPLRQEQFDRMVVAARQSQEIPLVIDDTPAITVAKLYGIARRMARSKEGLSMIVVDYLALMRGTQQARRQGKYAEVSEISADLLALAKTLGVPVIALQQLNREVEKRDDKRPSKSDLRDSGNLEQDASVIMLLYREEYYLDQEGPPKQKPTESGDAWMTRVDQWEKHKDAVRGKALWIIDKNRQGETGTIQMLFDGPGTWFRDIAEGEGSEPW